MQSFIENLNFEEFKQTQFQNRYILPEKLYEFLRIHYSENLKLLGHSTQGNPIYKLSIGNGAKKVLAWTQMHGNESSATLAVLDLLKALESDSFLQNIFQKLTLEVILMLNPDGSLTWQRRNSVGIDLNRDYLKQSSVEIKFLIKELAADSYDLALNLHDQRTIYNVHDCNPATISLLAPSEDVVKTITANRQKAMELIALAAKDLQLVIPNHIGRYNDDFYPKSCGDNIQKSGIPTILVEGGFSAKDYHREMTRKAYFTTIISILHHFVEETNVSHQDYFKIPENASEYVDILLKNVNILSENGTSVVDVLIQYKEVVNIENETIDYLPMIEELGDFPTQKAWNVYDAKAEMVSVQSLELGGNASVLLAQLKGFEVLV